MNTETSRSGRTRAPRRAFSSSAPRGRSRRFSRPDRPRGSSQRHGGGRRSQRVLPTFDPSQYINTNPVAATPEVYVPKHAFKDFGLHPRLVRTVAELNISAPTPIQDQVIPEILAGKDVVGLAETGTGKTAAFLLPLIEKTNKSYRRQTLILTPTRELALQVEAELRKLAKGFKFFSAVCVGGTNIRPQIRAVRRRNHFVIGTPGRIIDLIDRGDLKTNEFTTVILDEADRMLDMGFIHDMRKILSCVPKERETHCFSATMDEKTKVLVHDFLRDPVIISVKKKDITDSIRQDVVPYAPDSKFDTLIKLLNDDSLRRVIVFGAMKHSVEKLAKELCRSGVVAESIHGNKSHSQRQRSLAKFKSGNARVLVATDVAARGIHVDNVSHVINYDLPQTFEDYVHRIGRTGRGHEHGMALTLVPARARN